MPKARGRATQQALVLANELSHLRLRHILSSRCQENRWNYQSSYSGNGCSLRTGTDKDGGASRDRTDDLKLAKLPLSQLSYGPDPNWRQTPEFIRRDPTPNQEA